ncbi:MAG: hypothetical protein M3394_04605 [Actinomycetota bacterium]|nr:hypothetical protein [Actinomycetota bacterium]
MTLGIKVAGFLPTFPCGGSCRTEFSGVMTHPGTATVTTGWDRIPGVTSYPDPTQGWLVTFSMSSATVTGTADYVEPGTPVCPGKGSASGYVQVSAPASGVVTSASNPTVVGQVDAVYPGASFTYDRVGATAAIVAGGFLRIYFHTVSWSGYKDVLIDGYGDGEFVFDPQQAAGDCLAPGRLDYEVLADIAIETNAAYYEW